MSESADARWCTHCHTRDIGTNPLAGWGSHYTTERYDLMLLPAEKLALDVAVAQLAREEALTQNVAIVCINALVRITTQ